MVSDDLDSERLNMETIKYLKKRKIMCHRFFGLVENLRISEMHSDRIEL